MIITQSPQFTLGVTPGVLYCMGLNKYIIMCIKNNKKSQTCIHHIEQFHCPKNPLHSTCSSLLPPLPLDTSEIFTGFIVLAFPEGHIVRVIQNPAFSDWLFSLSNKHLPLLHIFSWLEGLFLFSAEQFPLSGCSRVFFPNFGNYE